MATLTQARTLALRLRQLRSSTWPESGPVTQQQLAKAFGVSVPLISSWENKTNPTVPSPERLANYALFFATRRSLEGGRSRLLEANKLTSDELGRRDELAAELMRLQRAALGPTPAAPARPHTAPVGEGFWHFTDGAPITIMCAQLPAHLRADEAYASPHSPDYVELFSYADLDALMELHGHLRAANPDSQVTRVLAANANPNQLATHLVVLGGVDWNPITREALDVLNIPVTQGYRDDGEDGEPDDGAFTVTEGEQTLAFQPQLRTDEQGRRVLVEDVAHFYRGPNPFNQKRTVTICNAMFGRGVYGIVRTLTDFRFRDRNAQFLQSRFRPGDAYSVLTKVQVIQGAVLTPDWTNPGTVLHEWSGRVS